MQTTTHNKNTQNTAESIMALSIIGATLAILIIHFWAYVLTAVLSIALPYAALKAHRAYQVWRNAHPTFEMQNPEFKIHYNG